VLVSDGAALPDGVHVHVDSVQEVRTNLPEVGTFNSNNDLLNKIYAAVKGSVAGDHVSGQMMDTPTYEKDGWTGDTQLVAPTASYIFDTQRQYRKSAQDAVDSQVIGDTIIGNTAGQISLLIPSARGYGYCSPTTNQYGCGNSPSAAVFKGTNAGITPIWDAFLQVLPYEAYNFYGDTLSRSLRRDGEVPRRVGGEVDGAITRTSTPRSIRELELRRLGFRHGCQRQRGGGHQLNVGGIQAPSSSAYLGYM
jgi:hypothetical protein